MSQGKTDLRRPRSLRAGWEGGLWTVNPGRLPGAVLFTGQRTENGLILRGREGTQLFSKSATKKNKRANDDILIFRMAKCCVNTLEERMRCCKARKRDCEVTQRRPQLERNGSLSTGGGGRKRLNANWRGQLTTTQSALLKQFTLDDWP